MFKVIRIKADVSEIGPIDVNSERITCTATFRELREATIATENPYQEYVTATIKGDATGEIVHALLKAKA